MELLVLLAVLASLQTLLALVLYAVQGSPQNQTQSQQSNLVILTLTVFRSIFWGWRLAVGGSFFLINALIFLITHRCLKLKGREGAGTPASSIVDPKVCWSC
ncbi:hypothetical protein Y1Q_0010580 [Alligator mississippiensis]|uniref:Uncharacterized protein n=1 Tax=Alligator mississippiensis TaxID=8496 RepID=A0A151PGP8_ALLMI|nr:hypothetical protein Y1Q_0010580 [Alligator mississippiensis]KYO48200.1 hypothetical protein Y1Q_0010580 [Alligator mississippiensis]